ncbi:MAG: 4Fe-4S dicluster domain-containing protein, partial [Dehalococcoidia bacterium]|nr:4Fe-4S dicluster domain-containing protein [Dehalococcoidia bacterium]
MTTAIATENIVEVIRRECGEKVMLCYQCKKCTVGCPVVDEMDLKPNQIMRALQFNQIDRVLNSKTIWLCASCKTCTTRCPNDIDITEIMDYL